MKPPGFWNAPPSAPGWQARFLAPLSKLYATATASRVARPPSYEARVPVICVGNINVGGTGKTPTVIALIERLSKYRVHVVSRGYGGSLDGPVKVKERSHTAGEVGDEPLLISAFAPTWVAKDRAAGVARASDADAEVIILDDGFQNPTVKKALSLVVVDAAYGFGNGRVLPAGPLREPVSTGLARADLLVTIGDSTAQKAFGDLWGVDSVSRVEARIEPLKTGIDWSGQKVLAFAGIGNPEKFFRTLRELGANILRAEALNDHQTLTTGLMKRLEMEALALNAQLVTTEKDAVRLPTAFRQKVITLPVRLQFAEADALDHALERIGL